MDVVLIDGVSWFSASEYYICCGYKYRIEMPSFINRGGRGSVSTHYSCRWAGHFLWSFECLFLRLCFTQRQQHWRMWPRTLLCCGLWDSWKDRATRTEDRRGSGSSDGGKQAGIHQVRQIDRQVVIQQRIWFEDKQEMMMQFRKIFELGDT